ncbi:MAG: glycosyltransferase, partial [Pseudomonadota bacterium]
MPAQTPDRPVLGVVVVTYCGADVIAACLETLIGARDVRLRVVVVDNGSPDNTLQVIRDWASGAVPFVADMPFAVSDVTKPVPLDGTGDGHQITLIETGQNTGFAGGVNR